MSERSRRVSVLLGAAVDGKGLVAEWEPEGLKGLLQQRCNGAEKNS